jgi:hypothetical protein
MRPVPPQETDIKFDAACYTEHTQFKQRHANQHQSPCPPEQEKRNTRELNIQSFDQARILNIGPCSAIGSDFTVNFCTIWNEIR